MHQGNIIILCLHEFIVILVNGKNTVLLTKHVDRNGCIYFYLCGLSLNELENNISKLMAMDFIN